MEVKNHRAVHGGELCDGHLTNGLVVELFRSGKYQGPRDGLNGFIPAAILRNKLKVWSFQSLGMDKGCFGELIEYGDEASAEYVIAVHDRVNLLNLFRVNDFVGAVLVKSEGGTIVIGGSSIEELLPIKLAVAESLNLGFTPSKEEWVLKLKLEQTTREAGEKARDEERKRAQDARELAARQHAEKVANIESRPKVHAFTRDGLKHYLGTPVYNDEEWKCLGDGRYCILMEGTEPIEAFIVSKQHAKVKKTRIVSVVGKKPDQTTTAMETGPQAIGQRVVEIRGEKRPIIIFSSMDDIRALRAAGLNSGTWVGMHKENATKIDVFAMNHGGITTVGVVPA